MKNFTAICQRALLVVFAVGAAQVALAQTSTPPTTGGPTPGPATVPLDGGASLLLAGGVAYGLRRLRQRRQRQPVGGFELISRPVVAHLAPLPSKGASRDLTTAT